MSIQVKISGHATGSDSDGAIDAKRQKAAEAKFIYDLRGVVRQWQEAGNEVYEASFSSQYHATGDLRDAPETVASSGSDGS